MKPIDFQKTLISGLILESALQVNYFSIYSEFDLESKRLVFDEKWVGSGVTEFLTEIRKEKGDRQYLPKIDRDIIIEIVERHAWLWIMLNQESVLGEELHQLIA